MSSSANEPFSQLQEVLLEFRAGKMQLDGKRVIPDSRKGLVRIGRGEEGLVHVQWLDRSQNIVEDDHIVFPEEAVFEKINQSSGRVYILKFHTDDRKFFYWMQEPNAEGDILLCNSVNFYLNLELPEDESDASVPIPSVEHLTEDEISSRAGNLVGPSMGAEATSDVTSAGPVKLAYLQRILSNIGGGSSELPGDESDASVPIPSVEHLAEDDISSRAGNLVGPSMGAEATSDVTSAGPVKLADLQRILSNIGGGSSAEAVDPEAGLGLGDILRPEFIRPLIQELTVDQELAYYLPEGQWTPEDLVELLQSPPFRQQLDSFTYVLRTGQVDLTQFGIDPSKYKFTVPSFLESLEDSVTKTSEESGQGSNDAMDEGQ